MLGSISVTEKMKAELPICDAKRPSVGVMDPSMGTNAWTNILIREFSWMPAVAPILIIGSSGVGFAVWYSTPAASGTAEARVARREAMRMVYFMVAFGLGERGDRYWLSEKE